MSKAPMRVAVSGAAGQIAYSLLFRIASGEMLGKDQPVILQLLDLPQAMQAAQGVMMELDDCAFPLLAGMSASDDANAAFKDADVCLLVGARPRTKGMERADLLSANGAIFTVQGRAIAEHAREDVRVLVVGNPCNTNAYIAAAAARKVGRTDPRNYHGMLRLDYNRARSQLAAKIGRPVASIRQLVVWGNHSPSMYADYRFATSNGETGTAATVQTSGTVQFFGIVSDTPFTSVRFFPSADPEPSMSWGDWVFFDDISVSASAVPEPSTFALLSIVGLLGTFLLWRKKACG